MADLPDMALIRQILESPWYVGFGVACSVAAWTGWRQFERRWAHQRRLELERWRHEQKLELELLEAEPDKVRTIATAIQALRSTGPQGSDPDRERANVPADRSGTSASSSLAMGSRLAPAGDHDHPGSVPDRSNGDNGTQSNGGDK